MLPPIVALAALMGLVTYATRIIPFLLPLTHLPEGWVRVMRFMGPATLASVAAMYVSAPAFDRAAGAASPTAVWLATGVCVALVAFRRSLAAGIAGALAAGAFVSVQLTP